MNDKQRIMDILNQLDQDYPNKQAELRYETPFQLLVGTILAAQATDKKVNEITPALFKDCPTPQAMAALSLGELESKIRQINFYKTKARNILATCHILLAEFNGEVPKTREALETLKGVGRKTANVMLSYGFDVQAIAVDTHVFRVAGRLGISQAKDVLKVEEEMQRKIPEEWWSKAHSSMVLHGRRVCHAKKPDCESCNLSSHCDFYMTKNE